MAKRYWDVNRGQTEFQVTTGSSSGSGSVEVVVDLAVMGTGGAGAAGKEETLRMLDMIKDNIVKGNWPPA